jgi:nucleoid-associated protein EbfC
MANMFDMLKQAAQLKKQASHFQKVPQSKVCEVCSPDEKIRLKVNGKMELLAIEIAADLLAPEHKHHLEKLLLKTWQAAQKEIERMIQSEAKSMLGDLPLGGLPF